MSNEAQHKDGESPLKGKTGPKPVLTLALMLDASSRRRTPQEVADETGRSCGSVYRACRKFKTYGVKLEQDSPGRKTNTAIVVAFKLGRSMTRKEIADDIGITTSMVGLVVMSLRKEGVKI